MQNVKLHKELHKENEEKERERISKLQNLEERESGFGGENQTEGTTAEREISRKRSLEEREPQIGGESELRESVCVQTAFSADFSLRGGAFSLVLSS